MMPLMFASPGDEVIIKKLAEVRKPKSTWKIWVCGWRNTDGSEFRQRKPYRQGQRDPYCHYQRNGCKNYDIRGGIQHATLKDAKIGQTVRVKKLTGEGAVKRRIMDMGITKGVEVYIRKVAPLGDPIEVTVRGYELSLRKADAELIEVE